jgi:hypothetical protein
LIPPVAEIASHGCSQLNRVVHHQTAKQPACGAVKMKDEPFKYPGELASAGRRPPLNAQSIK